jgi:exodeoxyribonuclease V alpha subunit
MPDITAKLKKVIWRSLENDFTIAAFQPEKDGSGHDLEFIATGDLFNPAAGITYEMSGDWTEHAKYGKQFKIDGYLVKEPVAVDSITVYLEKHVKGIGPVLADKLIEKYGEHTIRLLKKAPERVSNENKGISYKLALEISEQLQEGDKRQDVLIKLEGLFSKVKGLPKKLATDVLNIYGLSAYEVIKNNPYQLVEMNRIGFVSADKVGMACGVKCDDEQRIRAGVLYVIRQMMQETGDIWLNPDIIGYNLSKLINELKAAVVTHTIVQLISDKVLVSHGGLVTIANYAVDEDLIADCVANFL